MEVVDINGANRGASLARIKKYLQRGSQVIATGRYIDQALALLILASQLSVFSLEVTSRKTLRQFTRAVSISCIDSLICNASSIIPNPKNLLSMNDAGGINTNRGGKQADLRVGQSAGRLVLFISQLNMDQSGRFLSWQGKAVA